MKDVPFLLGHAGTPSGRSGTTVLLFPQGAVGGVDVRGGAPGTRETDLLHPANHVSTLHAIVLAGGSAFGLAAADGVMEYLAAQGVGLLVAQRLVPIVVAAILFDLPYLPPGEYPNARTGRLAAQTATPPPWPEGSVGAGAGASVAKILGPGRAVKGGLGIAEAALGDIHLTAVVAVNALGDVVEEDGRLMAGPRHPVTGGMVPTMSVWPDAPPPIPQNTTIAAVALDAHLTKPEATLVARMAQDGVARAIRPAHTAYDGDTVFVAAYGRRRAEPSRLGAIAADLVAEAIRRGVTKARGFPGLPAVEELQGDRRERG